MPNRDDHWFKFYYRNFLISTNRWTDEQVGAYLRLLIHQFDKDGLPSEDQDLKIMITSFKKSWPVVSKKFKKGPDGLLRNDFMKGIRDERDQKSNENSKNGKKGGRKKTEVFADNQTDEETERLANANRTLSHQEIERVEEEREQSSPHDLSRSNLFRQPVIPTKQQVWEVFTAHVSDKSKAKDMATAFWNKHQATGWFINGSPVVSFAALAQKFITNWKTNDKKDDDHLPASAPLKKLN